MIHALAATLPPSEFTGLETTPGGEERVIKDAD